MEKRKNRIKLTYKIVSIIKSEIEFALRRKMSNGEALAIATLCASIGIVHFIQNNYRRRVYK